MKIKIWQYGCSSYNNKIKCLWWLLNRSVHSSKMENEYFADNMVIYIEKKIAEKFSYDWIIW